MVVEKYDYIIIGSGSAGSIIAYRLSEYFPNKKILLVEAGNNDNNITVKIPAGYGYLFNNNKVNWKYYTEEIRGLNNRRDYWPKGKILGGSSSINAMVYIRGQKEDYDNWEINDWSWKDLLPYFIKLENHYLGKTSYHNDDGKIKISNIQKEKHQLTDEFIKSCINLGIKKNDDFNGQDQEGVGLYQLNTNKGVRSNVSREYLRKIKNKNFKLITSSHVSKIIFKDDIATGIEFLKGNKKFIANCNDEIILSAGSISSPQILQLSGVGNQDDLRNYNIDKVKHLRYVGQNLQDHLNVALHYKTNIKSLNDDLRPITNKIFYFLKWLLFKNGPLTLSINQAGAFVKSEQSIYTPDLQIYFLPLTASNLGNSKNASIEPDPFSGFTIAPCVLRPKSKGFVKIKSTNPLEHPSISPNYFDHDDDMFLMLKAYNLSNKISQTKPLKNFVEKKVGPHQFISSEDEKIDFIRQNSKTTYHPVGTCKMGFSDKDSVVDSSLKVHGFQNLRVADASVMPNIISGNTNAACMMIGEKCADIVRKHK